MTDQDVFDVNDSAKRCPVMHGPHAAHTAMGSTANQHWWPNQLNLKMLHQNSPKADPMGEDFDYAEEFKTLDLEAVKQDLDRADDRLAGLVARRLRPLRPVLHPHGLAQRRHLPHRRRSRRRRSTARSASHRSTAGRTTCNLDKARRLLWPIKQKYGRKLSWADLHDPDRQRRAGVDGLQDLRLRRRPRGRLGARGGHLLGPRDRPGSATSATPATASSTNPLGAVQMGLIYVNPEGPNGNPDPLASARDIRETFARMAMNDEETVALIAGGHTFGKAHGAADPDELRRSRARGRTDRAAGSRLEEQLRHRQGRRHDHQRSRGCVDPHPDHVGQQLLRHAVRLRMGADTQPGRRAAVDPQESGGRGHRARCPRSVEDTRPDDVHCGHGHEDGPRLRTDLEALPREPRRVRRRLRPGVVQADPPRHGPHRPVPRPGGPRRGADLAGSGPRGRPRADRRGRHRRAQGEGPGVRTEHFRAGVDRMGFGLDVPQQRQARRRQRCPHSPRSAERLGGQQPARAAQDSGRPSKGSEQTSTARARRCRWPT